MKKLILYSNVNSWHISRNLSLFEDLGYECRMFRWLDRDFFCRPFAIYLNWYENIKVGNIVASLTKFLLQIITLRFAKLFGIKIVASFHNKEPHNNMYPRLANYLFYLVFHLSDRIVIMTPRPGRISEVLEIRDSFPRERGSAQFLEKRRNILERFNLARSNTAPEYVI